MARDFWHGRYQCFILPGDIGEVIGEVQPVGGHRLAGALYDFIFTAVPQPANSGTQNMGDVFQDLPRQLGERAADLGIEDGVHGLEGGHGRCHLASGERVWI